MSKTAHILCVAAGHNKGEFAPRIGFNMMGSSIVDELSGDLWFGPRQTLEKMVASKHAPYTNLLEKLSKMAGASSFEGKKSLNDTLEEVISFGNAFKETTKEQLAYPPFIQIIPYYLLRYQGKYLRYLRTVTGGDERLHGKISIGIGGHIDITDAVANAEGEIDLLETLSAAGKRESLEEVGIDINEKSFRFIGTIYATDTPVDLVHVGVVGVCDLTEDQVAKINNNHEISEHSFMTLSEVKSEADADENKILETWTRMVIESNPLA